MYQIFFLSFFFLSSIFSINVDRSIVKIVSQNAYVVGKPWQAPIFFDAMASGFVVSSNQVLTNAHAVAQANYVKIQLAGFSKIFSAKVAVLGNDCDLALLEITDPEFADLSEPVIFGEEVQEGDEVLAIGYPLHDVISYTKGIVSRLHHKRYAHSGAYLYAVQIDAAVNPGNSGGPVLHQDKVVGVVFEKYSHFADATLDNMGFMIPLSIVKYFLQAAETGHYPGFPYLNMPFQYLNNPSLREYFRIDEDVTGLRIVDGCLNGELKEGDIVLKVDNVPLDNDGSIYFNGIKRDLFIYILVEKQIGDKLSIEFLRDGVVKECVVGISSSWDISFANKQSYLVYGGLVFVEEFSELLRKPVVVLKEVLPHPTTLAYRSFQGRSIKKIGNDSTLSLHKLGEYLDSDEVFHVIELEDGELIVFDENTKKENGKILERFQIFVDRFIP